MKETTSKYAVIFDLDGVISDTQWIHSTAESEALKGRGVSISPSEIAARFAGAGDGLMFETLLREHGVHGVPVKDLLAEKWLRMEQLMQNGITAIPFVIPLIRNLKESGFALAVASGSSREFIARILKELKIEEFFETYVSGDEMQHGKPAPDIFLEAARRLDVPPARCVVIEDGLNGMRGAQAAGMPCIALVTDPEFACQAQLKVTSFQNIDCGTVKQLLLQK